MIAALPASSGASDDVRSYDRAPSRPLGDAHQPLHAVGALHEADFEWRCGWECRKTRNPRNRPNDRAPCLLGPHVRRLFFTLRRSVQCR